MSTLPPKTPLGTDTCSGLFATQVATDMGNSLEFVDFGADYTGRAVDISSGPCALFDDGGVKWCVVFCHFICVFFVPCTRRPIY